MEMKKQRGAHNVPRHCEIEVDIISNLPGHIVDKVLSCLSLRDVVRTSILSRKWRYKWVTFPYLIFDQESILPSTKYYKNTCRKKRVVSIVDRVLLLHTGPILTFNLSEADFEGIDECDIDRWILHLSRGGSVKHLILELCESDRYKVPSSIYSCQKLTHLELSECDLKPPLEFNGFKSLVCLTFVNITIEQLGFERMMSSCPLLEWLCLQSVDGLTLLNIHAPNLLHLDVENHDFIDFNLQNTFNLATVSVVFEGYHGIVSNPSCNNLIHFFTCLPHIQRLDVQCRFLTHLADGTIPKKLATSCLDLTFLSISINFHNTKENLAALCLLRSSPNLQKLELHAIPEEQTTTTTEDNIVESFEKFPLNQLRLIKVSGELTQELRFIKLLLENAPLLETMTVNPRYVYDERDLLTKLLCFRRASTAQIIYRLM